MVSTGDYIDRSALNDFKYGHRMSYVDLAEHVSLGRCIGFKSNEVFISIDIRLPSTNCSCLVGNYIVMNNVSIQAFFRSLSICSSSMLKPNSIGCPEASLFLKRPPQLNFHHKR